MRTNESRMVEKELLRRFAAVDAYRYNSGSLRVRIIDPVFAGLSEDRRDKLVERALAALPEDTRSDIVNVVPVAPDEISPLSRWSLLLLDFEDPRPSGL